MDCFSELKYSIYVDGELPAEERWQVDEHLLECPRCRPLVAALRREASLLSDVLQSTPAEALETATGLGSALGILGAFSGMVAVAVGVVMTLTWAGREFLGSAPLFNPLNRAAIITVFVDAALYLANQGASMLYSIVTTLSALMLGFLVLVAVRLALRRNSLSMGLLAGLGLAFLLGSPAPATAMERRGGTVVTVPASQTIDDSLFVAGQSVSINGTVNGNVYVWCQRVVIRGDIKGDLFTGNQSLEINGTVEGNVYTYSQNVVVRGHVTRGLHAFSANLEVDKDGQVGTDTEAFSGDARVDGAVGRDLNLRVGTLEMTGHVGRNVHVQAGDTITVFAPARIDGNLEANVNSSDHVHIEPGAAVAGKTDVHLTEKAPSRYSQPRFYVWQAVRLGAALLTGFILFLLFPTLFAGRIESALGTLSAVGIGFVLLIVPPIAAVAAGITLVGLPMGLLGLMAWIAGLYLAKVFVAAAIGRMLVPPGADPKRQNVAFALSLLLGLVIVFVAINLPYIAWLTKFLVLLLGLDLLGRQVLVTWRRTRSRMA
ncbi:MAG TPA: zf-HC2 domain-containing protein [Terriglobia bacterium]|nr:zf-HC2 domain-containing protein [Terriglobia bacterium]